MADNLAKQMVCDAKNDPSLILDINNIQQGLRFESKWNGIYIDRSLRSFVSIMTKNSITAEWALLKHNQPYNKDIKRGQLNPKNWQTLNNNAITNNSYYTHRVTLDFSDFRTMHDLTLWHLQSKGIFKEVTIKL